MSELELPKGIVRLGAQDLSRVLKLDALHNKHMNVDKAGRFDSSFWQRFLTNDSDRHILLGYEEDGELHGTIGMFLWPSFPYWTVSGFMLRPGRRAYSYTTNPALTALWDGSLDVAESMGRYKFYMLKSNKWRTPKRVQDWYTYVGDPRGYTLGIETVIEPNTMPRWKGYWFLMAEQTWPEQLHIMCGTKLHYNID